MASLHSSPSITPFLWFDSNAEEAVDFYCSVFPDARKLGVLYNTGDAPGPKGGVLAADFELQGLRFTALNGVPAMPFTQAISLVVRCETQQEIDRYWTALTDGGKEIQCGWLCDKFGLSWQIVPANIFELLRTSNAMQAMMQMVKLDIAALERAGA